MNTRVPINLFKQAIREGRPQIGLWSSLCNNLAAEVIAGSGFDWILIDTEHAPNELPMVLSQLQAQVGGRPRFSKQAVQKAESLPAGAVISFIRWQRGLGFFVWFVCGQAVWPRSSFHQHASVAQDFDSPPAPTRRRSATQRSAKARAHTRLETRLPAPATGGSLLRRAPAGSERICGQQRRHRVGGGIRQEANEQRHLPASHQLSASLPAHVRLQPRLHGAGHDLAVARPQVHSVRH